MAQKEVREIVLTRPAEKACDRAIKGMRRRFDGCLEDLEKNPLYGNDIKALTGRLKELYRYRVGEWRVIYRLRIEEQVVEIIAILPRGDAYK